MDYSWAVIFTVLLLSLSLQQILVFRPPYSTNSTDLHWRLAVPRSSLGRLSTRGPSLGPDFKVHGLQRMRKSADALVQICIWVWGQGDKVAWERSPAHWSCCVRCPDRLVLSLSTCDLLMTSLRNGRCLTLQRLEFYKYLQSFYSGAGESRGQ